MLALSFSLSLSPSIYSMDSVCTPPPPLSKYTLIPHVWVHACKLARRREKSINDIENTTRFSARCFSFPFSFKKLSGSKFWWIEFRERLVFIIINDFGKFSLHEKEMDSLSRDELKFS